MHRVRPTNRLLTRFRKAKESRLAFLDVVDFVCGTSKSNPNAVFAGSVPYLMLAGNVMAGWQMARSLLIAEEQLAVEDTNVRVSMEYGRTKLGLT